MLSLEERMQLVLNSINQNFIENINSQEIVFRRGVLYHDDIYGNLKRIGFFKLNKNIFEDAKLPASIENMISHSLLERQKDEHEIKYLQLYFFTQENSDSLKNLIEIYKENNIEIHDYNYDFYVLSKLYQRLYYECSIRATRIFEEINGVVSTYYLIHFYKNIKHKPQFIVKARSLDLFKDNLFNKSLANELNIAFNTHFTENDLKSDIESCFKIIKIQMY